MKEYTIIYEDVKKYIQENCSISIKGSEEYNRRNAIRELNNAKRLCSNYINYCENELKRISGFKSELDGKIQSFEEEFKDCYSGNYIDISEINENIDNCKELLKKGEILKNRIESLKTHFGNAYKSIENTQASIENDGDDDSISINGIPTYN